MFEKLFSLSGKRALVTGSSRGIGRAAAMLLGEAGADVIFHASKPSEKLDQALAEAKGKGISCRAIAADLADPNQVDRLIRETGAVDLLILNASVQTYMTVENFEAVEFEREYSINVETSFRLVQGFLPGMKERKFGRIVTLGSVNRLRPSARLILYAGTKAAQNTLVLAVAREYAKFGITANNVDPGVIATDRNTQALSSPEMVKMLLDGIPAKRFGTAEDCAGVILLLCSEAGSYINGDSISIDGGMHL